MWQMAAQLWSLRAETAETPPELFPAPRFFITAAGQPKMHYPATACKPPFAMLSSGLIATLCSVLSACGGGSASSDTERALSAELPSMATAAATSASAADIAGSAPVADLLGGSKAEPLLAQVPLQSASGAVGPNSKLAAAGSTQKADAVTTAVLSKLTSLSPSLQAGPTNSAQVAVAPLPSVGVAPTTAVTNLKNSQTLATAPTNTQLSQLALVSAPVPTPQATGGNTNNTQATATPTASIWNQLETQATAAISNGNGLTTTASNVVAYQAPALGIFFGFRDAREDWPLLIDRFKRSPDIANWVKSERARVDAWMARGFERKDLVGGWVHDYVDPKTKQVLKWTPESPEPPEGSTSAEKAMKSAWVALGRDYNTAQVQTAARLFKLTGEVKYANWAAQQLDFYAANYASWPLRTLEGKSTMYQQGLDEAVASFALIDSARLLETFAGTSRYNGWRDKLFMPLASNLKSTSAPMSNIALWHNAAIAAIAMRFKDTALLDYAHNGSQGIKAVMAYALTADNFWIEGTFSYNNYVLDGLSKLLTQAGVEGYGSRFGTEREQALRLLLAAFDYRFDNNSLPNPNDSTAPQTVIAQPAHWWLYRFAPTYWGLDKANKWRTWESLLDVPATVPSTEPVIPTAMTRNFPTLRQAVLRAGTWQAYVHYGQSMGNHFQEELTTFELHEGTTPLAYDPGTSAYGTPQHKAYFHRGAANNVPLINGEGQNIWAKGNVLSFTAEESRLVVEQPKYQTDARVTRAYRVTSSGFVEKSDIKVTNGQNKRLGVVFNTTCDVQLGAGSSTTQPLRALPNASSMDYWKNTVMRTSQGSWQATLTCGANKYLMSVTGPANQRIYVSRAPNTPMPSERNAIYYETDGTEASFETEFRKVK